jgi:AGZA family xanthine/uracil permease-like MFS transporter
MERFFGLKAKGTTVATEVLAGTTTFISLAYVISLIPNAFLKVAGIAPAQGFTAFLVCAIISTLIGAFYANLPIAFASGIGLSAFFAFTVCAPANQGGMGYTIQVALTALLLEGIVFIFLSAMKVREQFMDAIPFSLKKGISVGIGLFIAIIGFVDSGVTQVGLKFEPDTIFPILKNDPSALFGLHDVNNLFIAKFWDHGHLTPAFWSVVGLFLIAVLVAKRVKGAILLGILAITLAGLLPVSFGGGFTHLPKGALFQIPAWPKMFQYDWSWTKSLGGMVNIFIILFTLLFVDMFDTIGTLMGIGAQGKLLDKEGKFPGASKAFMADAVGTTFASMFGTTAITAYIESASGVAEGGRTGLTALVVAGWMAIALFLSPLFLMVPLQATSPALMMIGFFMLSEIKEIAFDDITEAVPAYLAVIVMPFTFSIVNGIALGMIAYTVLKAATGRFREINPIILALSVVFLLKLLFLSA